MTWTLKHKPMPGSPMIAEYECEFHGRFERLVQRDDRGDPPGAVECLDVITEGEQYDEGRHDDEDTTCGEPSRLVISAPSIKFWSRDPVAIGRASKSDEKDPRALDTEPLATGKMTRAEWKKYQHGITLERRHQKLLKAGKRSKRIQVGGG